MVAYVSIQLVDLPNISQLRPVAALPLIWGFLFVIACVIVGYYMYIETSSPRVNGDDARLFSPFYLAPVATCDFSFWYHMYGSTVGRLDVNVVTSSNSTRVWTRSGSQGNSWKSATVSLGSVTSVFRVCALCPAA